MLDLIEAIQRTLDTINVHGRDDIDAMLGVMMALDKLKEQCKNEEVIEDA